jgi:hypothetical protein
MRCISILSQDRFLFWRSMASSRSRGSLGHSPKRDLDGAETGLDRESTVVLYTLKPITKIWAVALMIPPMTFVMHNSWTYR